MSIEKAMLEPEEMKAMIKLLNETHYVGFEKWSKLILEGKYLGIQDGMYDLIFYPNIEDNYVYSVDESKEEMQDFYADRLGPSYGSYRYWLIDPETYRPVCLTTTLENVENIIKGI